MSRHLDNTEKQGRKIHILNNWYKIGSLKYRDKQGKQGWKTGKYEIMRDMRANGRDIAIGEEIKS